MALIVGLDIGSRVLKGAVLSGSPGKYRLVDFFVEVLPHVEDATELAETADGEAHLGADGHDIEDRIQRILAERNLRGADVVVAANTKDCVIREITVPFVRDEQLRKTIPFEAENYFHAFDAEEVVLEYVKIDETEGKSRLILMALKNSIISDRLEFLKRGGCDPISMDLDAAALVNAYAATPYFDEERSALLIDMGASSAEIVLVEQGRLKKVRSLRLGTQLPGADRMIAEPAAAGESSDGDGETADAGEAGGFLSDEDSLEVRFKEIEEALGRLEPISSDSQGVEPGVDLDEGSEESDTPIAVVGDEEYSRLRGIVKEGLGEKAGETADPESAPTENADGDSVAPAFPGALEGDTGAGLDYREYLERIGIEIQRTFATTKLASPIELICLTGGMGGREDARRYFSEEFDVDAVMMDFGDTLPSDLEPDTMGEVSSEGAVAVGLALKGMEQDRVGIDFRKGAFRYEHRFERLKLPLLLASVLCLVFFLQTAFWSYHEYESQNKRAKQFALESKAIYEAFFEKELIANRDPLKAALAQKKVWEGKGHSDAVRYVDFVASMRDFSKTLSSTNIYYQLQDMTFKFMVRKNSANRRANRARKATRLKGEKSIVRIKTPDSRAHLTIESAFLKHSEFFTASPDTRPVQGQDDYRVMLTLELKDQALKRLE